MWSEFSVRGADVTKLLALEDCQYNSLTDTFLASKSVRFGPRPTGDNMTYLNERLGECEAMGRPIHVLTMWGAAKGYGVYPNQNADLLDLMALKRFACLQRDVQRFHKPGIKVTIILEDFTRFALAGYKSPAYRQSLQDLMDATGLGFVSIVTESSLIDDTDEFAMLVATNAASIFNGHAYDIGWTGPIAWDHYMRRAQSENPTLDDIAIRMKVSTYLGITLARYQKKLLPASDVKLSFVPYPECVPDTMRRGRVEYKVKPNKSSHRTAAPWTSLGCLNKDDWTHVSLRDLRSGHFETSSLNINGTEVPYLQGV